MSDKGKFSSLLFKPTTPAAAPLPEADPEAVEFAPEAVEDLGRCAAIAKDRWVTALTIKGRTGWTSFLYRGMDTQAEYTPSTSFRLRFVGESDTKEITVTGRNLERIYSLCVQGRMEWLQAADRDYAVSGEMIITSITVTKVEEAKGGK